MRRKRSRCEWWKTRRRADAEPVMRGVKCEKNTEKSATRGVEKSTTMTTRTWMLETGVGLDGG